MRGSTKFGNALRKYCLLSSLPKSASNKADIKGQTYLIKIYSRADSFAFFRNAIHDVL